VVALERLDADSIRDLSRRTDELGVLSVYVNADPRLDPNLRTTAIDLKNRYRELQRRIGEAGDGRSRKIAGELERIRPDIEHLANPKGSSGLGRIAFIALDDGWTLRLESALPVANRVVLDDAPFLHPLLELLDEGRPAGVVIASARQARVLEWRVGVLQELSTMEREYVEAPHERAGQRGGGPPGQYHSPIREQRDTREWAQAQRFLDQVGEVAARLAEERGWERILVSCGEQWTEECIERIPQPLRDKVSGDTRVLTGLDDAALAQLVTEWAHAQHAEWERRLLDEIRANAGPGRGVLGLSEVATALSVGRVSHLVYDPQVRYVGRVGANGTLYGGDEVGPDGGSPDPRFTERMIERALETRARIIPIEGAAGSGLADADGIAALLRW